MLILGLAGVGLNACTREAPRYPLKGMAFPEFELLTLEGMLRRGREYSGRPRLINFWATWCPPCRREMADLDALRKALGPRGLALLAISVDADINLLKEYLLKMSPSMASAVLCDVDRRWSTSALGILNLPTTYLVGGDDLIREVWVGPREWATPEMQAAIAVSVGLAP